MNEHPWPSTIIHWTSIAAALVVCALVGHWVDGSAVNGYYHEVILDVGINIALAVSLNLILGLTGQFSLGHAGFLAAGAYTSMIVLGHGFPAIVQFFSFGPFHFSANVSFSIVLFLGVLAGAAVAGVLGWCVGLPTLRLRGDYLAIATLGFGEILAVIIQNTDYLGSATGLSLSSLRQTWLDAQPDATTPLAAMVNDFTTNVTYDVGFFSVFALVIVTIAIVRNIKYSTEGRALQAIREDTIASEAVGVPTTRYKVAAFVIGAALAGAAGGLVAGHKSLINPEGFRFMRSIEIVVMVILGGQGSITGSVFAAAFLTTLPEFLRSSWTTNELAKVHISFDVDKWRWVIYSLMLILAMLFLPQGIFGRYEITDLWNRIIRRRREPGPATAADAAHTSSFTQTFATHVDPNAPLLQATAVGMSFGGLRAVDGFNIALKPGELVGLIGPNGAGKTTIFNMLTGVYRPTDGQINLGTRSVLGYKPHRLAEAGIARTFQNIRLFQNLSVIENVQIAQHTRNRHGLPTAILRTPAFYRQEHDSYLAALDLLALFNLRAHAQSRANSLSYGDQRRLEIARALATHPQVLLIDEPAAGMNPSEKRHLMEMLLGIRERFHVTILIIEHDMKFIMGMCQRLIVLDYGRTIAAGTPEAVRNDPAVIKAYLGAAHPGG
jgi:branched-chain amino acid transport system permease protein